ELLVAAGVEDRARRVIARLIDVCSRVDLAAKARVPFLLPIEHLLRIAWSLDLADEALSLAEAAYKAAQRLEDEPLQAGLLRLLAEAPGNPVRRAEFAAALDRLIETTAYARLRGGDGSAAPKAAPDTAVLDALFAELLAILDTERAIRAGPPARRRLLAAQRPHRVQSRGTRGRDEARRERGRDQQPDDSREDQRIGRGYAEEDRLERTGGGERQREANRRAGKHHHDPLPQHQGDDVHGPRADRHPDVDLLRPPRDDIRDDAVEPRRREQQRDDAEHAEQRTHKALGRDVFVDHAPHGALPCGGRVRLERNDFAPDRGGEG